MTTIKRAVSTIAAAGALCLAGAVHAQTPSTPSKIVVSKQADLPRFSYSITGTATQFVEADAATFNALAGKVRHDVDGLLAGYQIEDASTLTQLLSAKLDLQELAGDNVGGLQTIAPLRALEKKPDA